MLAPGWALAVVTSRAFRVAGPTAPAALLPLIDMANHSFQPNCEVVPVPGGVAMVAKRQVGRAAALESAALHCIAGQTEQGPAVIVCSNDTAIVLCHYHQLIVTLVIGLKSHHKV